MPELEAYFDTFLNFERLPDSKMLKLSTMERLADLLGHPELAYHTIHVAGSKGKGSVSAMLAHIIAEQTGEPVGIFASPHFINFRERITSTAGFFSEDLYQAALADLKTVVDQLRTDGDPIVKYLTWFEMVTLFAFLVFKHAGCHYAVFEVGMGGRLDATNIIHPDLSVITNIELEHTEFLGDTLAKIAREKAGIIKPHTPVLIGAKHPETAPVFRTVAAEQAAPLHFLEPTPLTAHLQLRGACQTTNAGLAAAAAHLLFADISAATIIRGLERTTLPARFDLRSYHHRPVILDSAHTVNSIKDTLATFQELYQDQPADLLFALAADKDAAAIAPLFRSCHFDHIYLTRPGDFKKSDLPRLVAAFHAAGISTTFVDPDYVKVIRTALAGSHPLLVTGSFYLSAEVAKLML